MKIKFILILLLIVTTIIVVPNITTAKADELTDNIYEQLENIDLSELENYYDNLNVENGNTFFDIVNSFIKGDYSLDFSSFGEYIFSTIFYKISSMMPVLITVVGIAVLCSIVHNLKGSFFDDGISDVVFFVCFSTIILLLASHIISLLLETKNIIENIAKLTEIMSPILLTLMTANGANTSAGLYKPIVVFLSSGIINIFLSVLVPIISVMIIFSIISNFSNSIRLKKYLDFFSSMFKWIIGIIVTIFTVYLSIQGISSATHDGISIKIAKYALSNSIPIVGGFVRDGLDIVLASSLIIKNTVGISSVIMLFYTILSPIITLIVFSLMLKLCSAIVEPISDSRICDFCSSLSKCVTYLIVCILCVGLMLFVTILLLMFSASVFI